MIIATRSSPLARWQAEAVANRLASSAVDVEFLIVTTEGDQDRTRQIREMAGRGVFVKEVQLAVLEGKADLAVHSAKDLMSSPTAGLNLAGFLERGDPRDALIGMNLSQLPKGARIATGSARRQAQLAHMRPDLKFTGLRGNMETRIAVAERDDVDAVIVAMAALQRLGFTGSAAEVFSVEEMIPQVGQGAIALECRDDDLAINEQLLGISDDATRRCVEAERAFLAELGGGCELPVGAYAYLEEGIIQLAAVLAARDGTTVLRTQKRGEDADALGKAVAEELLAKGGRALLSINGASS
ncbi:MAG: hydroxymethylbilane synthase [Actinomycetota bacterium]|nr:hydroxymethylbilane synthase [Actinomycetota bacterium]